ncbi:MAG: hypothetical protein ACFFD7_17070, partial [Candidatus Thorarchaeota archaeon]
YDKRCQSSRSESPEFFDARIRLYENMQELHRIHESLRLISLTEKSLKPTTDLVDLPRLKITHAFTSDNIKLEAENYFQEVGVRKQIKTILLDEKQITHSYDVGILETVEKKNEWKFLVNNIKNLLKRNSLLWVLGRLTSFEREFLKENGFNPYIIPISSVVSKIKNLSKKICYFFWKFGLYPYPYVSLKPTMDIVSNLNVYLQGWQARIPFLY